MKCGVRAIVVSLVGTLSLGLLLCGFAEADRNIRISTFPENAPIAGIRVDTHQMRCEMTLLGGTYAMDLDWANEAAGLAQQISCFAPPVVRLGAKVIALGIREIVGAGGFPGK